MGRLIAIMAALGTIYPESKEIFDAGSRHKQIVRLMAKTITIAAFNYRHSIGMPYSYPDNDLSYTGNFLNMMFKMTEQKYTPSPVLERALDVLFILHADHEQNCSTNAMRAVGSSHVDPYSAVAAAAAALYGPLHGGANEAVLHMLREIGSVNNIPDFIKRVKSGEGQRLMGFGHRVYKNYDPRAKIIKDVAYDVFEVTGKNPMLDIALELERIALEDDYFVKRKLYPNVDFYSGLIYEAMSSRWRCSRCSSPSAACRAGSRSGRRCSPTPTRRSPARGRSTPGRSGAITFRRTSADGTSPPTTPLSRARSLTRARALPRPRRLHRA